MNTNKTILISGITSSIGISLAKLLVSKGYRVRGFSRSIDKASHLLDHPSIKLFKQDLLDQKKMHQLSEDVYAIVHLAALSKPFGKYADFYKTNVRGTDVISQAAINHRVHRFIHVSTPSLYFAFKDAKEISETTLPCKPVNHYAMTKKMAEELILQKIHSGLNPIIIRPRAIFGPHDEVLFPRLLKAAKTLGIPKFTRKSPIVDITYVDNVASALLCAIEANDCCVGEIYNITNGEPAPLFTILQSLLEKLSLPYRSYYFPYFLAFPIAKILEIFSTFTGKEPLFTPYTVGVLTYSQTLSIEKAKKELLYTPHISLEEGIHRYVSWLQNS